MKHLSILLLILQIVYLFYPSQSWSEEIECKDGEIILIISKLQQDNDNVINDMKLLAKNPYQAVACLLKELKIVPERRILATDFKKHRETLHIIWCIRALRYLTGKDFKAKTSYIFKPSEKVREYWLRRESNDMLPFFAVWMSRDSIYIAPSDTQKEIINQWTNWFFIEGKTYEYRIVDDINQWYF